MKELFNYRHVLPNGGHYDCVIGEATDTQQTNDPREGWEQWKFIPITNFNPNHGEHGHFSSSDAKVELPSSVKRIGYKGNLHEIYINPSRDQLENVLKATEKDNTAKALRGFMKDGNAYVWPTVTDDKKNYVDHNTAITKLFGYNTLGDNGVPMKDRFYVEKVDGKPTVECYTDPSSASSDLKKWATDRQLVINFNPNHGEHGQFASGSWKGAKPSSLHGLFERIEQSDGGFTYSMTTGSEPTKGYVVSPYPAHSWAVDSTKLKPVDIVRYVKKNKDLLSQPDAFLGAWHDPASHKVFLDVSVVKQDEKQAHELALKHDQIAYFDLSTFKSVTVNPKATSGGVTNVRSTTAESTRTNTGTGSLASESNHDSQRATTRANAGIAPNESQGQSRTRQSVVPSSQADGQGRNTGRDRGNEKGNGKALISNAGRWAFNTDSEKVDDFLDWLREQFDAEIIGLDEQQLWDKYIQDGFYKGASRAYDDFEGSQIVKQGIAEEELPAFQAGAKQQFLRTSFANPETADKIKLVAGRTFEELNNVTNDMATRMRRVLSDGLAKGQSPIEIARDLNKQTDLGANRALLISRTELIRAHAEGQLHALDTMGVEEVGVAVEFSTTGDGNVCPECAALQGAVFTLDEAHGMIPVHPDCRCAFIPANVGEDKQDQIRSKDDLDDALDDAGIDDLEVDEDRPEDITDNTIIEQFGYDVWFEFITNADVSEELRDDKGRWTKGGFAKLVSFAKGLFTHKIEPSSPEQLVVPTTPERMEWRMNSLQAYRVTVSDLKEKEQKPLEWEAKQRNMTFDQYETFLNNSVKDLVKDKDMYIRIYSQVLPKILESGRIKTQFETHKSMGLNSPTERRDAEEQGMGVPLDAPDKDRPVSGYLAPKDWAGLSDKEGPANYGSIVAKLKPSCRGRSTVTFGDSLSKIVNDEAVATPLDKPNHYSVPLGSKGMMEQIKGMSYGQLTDHFHYIETQTHGGIGLDDIEEIAFQKDFPPIPAHQEILKQHGIKWRVYDSKNPY